MAGSALSGDLGPLLHKVRSLTDRLTRCADALDPDGIDRCIQERGEAMKRLSDLYRSLKPRMRRSEARAFAEEYGALEGQAEFARRHLEKICRSCRETAEILRQGRSAIQRYGSGEDSPEILNRAC